MDVHHQRYTGPEPGSSLGQQPQAGEDWHGPADESSGLSPPSFVVFVPGTIAAGSANGTGGLQPSKFVAYVGIGFGSTLTLIVLGVLIWRYIRRVAAIWSGRLRACRREGHQRCRHMLMCSVYEMTVPPCRRFCEGSCWVLTAQSLMTMTFTRRRLRRRQHARHRRRTGPGLRGRRRRRSMHWRRSSSARSSASWRRRRWRGPAMQACRRSGAPATRWGVTIPVHAGLARSSRSATAWKVERRGQFQSEGPGGSRPFAFLDGSKLPISSLQR